MQIENLPDGGYRVMMELPEWLKKKIEQSTPEGRKAIERKLNEELDDAVFDMFNRAMLIGIE